MDKKILLYPVFALFCVLYFVGIPSFVLEKLDDKYDFDIEGYHLEDLVQVTETGFTPLTDYTSAIDPLIID